MQPPSRSSRRYLGVHPNVIWLGLVSLLNDMGGEMLKSVVPLFLANVLGASLGIVGAVQGLSESTAMLMQLPSGWLSDRLRRRKGLTVLGYSLSALAKPFLFFANGWQVVMALRFVDRAGKGLRDSPRDALLVDTTARGERGRSFGVHQALDTAGGVLGILSAALVVYFMQGRDVALERDTFHTLVFVATAPAVLSVLLLWRFVKETRPAKEAVAGPAPRDGDPPSRPFPIAFKVFLAVVALFTLARFGEAFLVLRAQDVGLSLFQVLLLLAGFNLVSASLSAPMGVIADRMHLRTRVMLVGWVLYALVSLGLARADRGWHIVLLVLAYGVYHAATEGVGRAIVADLVPPERRGLAFGLYYMVVGVLLFPAGLIAGLLWHAYGPAAPFLFGAGLAGLAAALVVFLLMRPGEALFHPRA